MPGSDPGCHPRKGQKKMHRIGLLGLLLLAGCQGLVGPRQRALQPERIDDPRLTIPEQEARGRDRLGTPQASWEAGPRTYAEQPFYRDRP
jgi:hypothetical protein